MIYPKVKVQMYLCLHKYILILYKPKAILKSNYLNFVKLVFHLSIYKLKSRYIHLDVEL